MSPFDPAELLTSEPHADLVEALPAIAARLTIGKRLPDAVYLHVETVRLLPEGAQRLIARLAEQAGVEPESYNVLKLGTLSPKVSFLRYTNFFDDPFPALAHSWSVDARTRSVSARRYDMDRNPPILHRKETLLPADHQRLFEYRALTEALDAQGLLEDANAIGRRRAWEERLRARGVRVQGHLLTLIPRAVVPDDREVQIERHRTAIERSVLSTPMQFLWRHGYLDGSFSVFDYGCGRGGDLRAICEAGLPAAGWDPYFAPSDEKTEADIVNLGFVLNVIESTVERRDALVGAFSLARRLLVVAVMVGGPGITDRFQRFGDGVVTQRNTFQKYFSQDEIRAYLESTLGREPIACAPGVFFIFRSDEDEQAFLAARYASTARLSTISVSPTIRAAAPRSPRASSSVRGTLRPDAQLVDAFWSACLTLGRAPETLAEFDQFKELRRFGKPDALLADVASERGREALDDARRRREADLLVLLAMNQFEKRRSQGTYPDAVRRNLRSFFGSLLTAEQTARSVLFSIAKEALLRDAAKEAAARGLGFLDQEHSLQLHSRSVPLLPPLLRVYAACAARLYGDLESVDLVKLHLGSGKVTLVFFDDFEGKAIPMMTERVKVNLRTQSIDFFRYGAEFPIQPLYLKSRFITPDFPCYEEQRCFDRDLTDLDLFDFSGFGPPWAECLAKLAAKGLQVEGFTLDNVSSRR